jgi:hypothetical protein
VPLRNIVRGPIEPTVPQLELWAVSDNGASEALNMYEANDIWMQHDSDPRVNTCRRMIWLRRVGIFLDYKFAYSTDSGCTELLDIFSPADTVHIKYPLTPITIYATKQEINQYRHRFSLIRITEIGEAQAIMEAGWLRMNTSTICICKHRYRTNAYGSRILVPATQSRQQCTSFELSHD